MDGTEIGAALRERRKRLHLTQEEAATLAETNRKTISAIEKGDRVRGVTLGTLLNVSRVLGLELSVGPVRE